jgi:hypothetical protein
MYNLMQELEERYSPLLQEAEELKGKLAVLISDTSFKLELRQLEAKVKVTDGEVLRLTSEGEFDEAEKKEQEKREIAGRLRNLTSKRNQEIDGLKERISSLSSERKNIASEILKEAWPSIQKEAWNCLEEAVDFIDSAWKETENFQRETGATAPGVGTHSLKIYQNSDQRKLWEKVGRWVHVPV